MKVTEETMKGAGPGVATYRSRSQSSSVIFRLFHFLTLLGTSVLRVVDAIWAAIDATIAAARRVLARATGKTEVPSGLRNMTLTHSSAAPNSSLNPKPFAQPAADLTPRTI